MKKILIILIIVVLVIGLFVLINYYSNAKEKNPLKVYESPNEKIRVGNNNDGGYVIMKTDKPYDYFISCGISNDISFENHFLKLNPYVRCVAFDGTINGLPEQNRRIDFIKKNIGTQNTEKTNNLDYYLKNYKNVMLKMDIEGAEHEWIKSTDKNFMENILQMVIEIHFDKNNPETLKKLAETHHLIHVHGNNCCGVRYENGNKLPNVFECTYIRKKDFNNLEQVKFYAPTELDNPNLKDKKDIKISA